MILSSQSLIRMSFKRPALHKSHTFTSLSVQTGDLAWMMQLWMMHLRMMCTVHVQNLYSTEEQGHCFTNWCQTALQYGSPASLTETTVDSERAEVGSQAPDVIEGYAGKVDTPTTGQTASKETGETFVAAVLTTVEALVRVPPHTVTGMDAVWLG